MIEEALKEWALSEMTRAYQEAKSDFNNLMEAMKKDLEQQSESELPVSVQFAGFASATNEFEKDTVVALLTVAMFRLIGNEDK